MGEWPQTQFLFGGAPELGQTVGFNNQEPHNQATKDHQFGV
jgi:hypothetical protein